MGKTKSIGSRDEAPGGGVSKGERDCSGGRKSIKVAMESERRSLTFYRKRQGKKRKEQKLI